MKKYNRINYTFYRVFGSLLLVFFLTSLSGCHRKGCTDPKANNYDSRSKKDDESCSYDSQKFIGTYSMNEDCDGEFNYQLIVTSDPTDLSYVLLNNLGGLINYVTIPALVNGDNLSFDAVDDGFRFVGSGYYEVNDTLKHIHLNYELFDSDNVSIRSCSSDGYRQ